MKIMIVGAGGVGGLLAGMLSRENPDITLIARGESLRAIQEKGIHIIDNEKEFTARPALVTDTPEEAGVQDVILLCTKGYGLDGALEQIAPCVEEHTLLVPLLNGINAHKRIAAKLKKGVVCEGAIYVFSRMIEPGVIEKGGAMLKICMGIPHSPPTAALLRLRDMLIEAGIPSELPEDILRESWNKWVFILANAQCLAYHNLTAGQMREDPEKLEFTLSLLREGMAVAQAEGVRISETIKEDLLTMVFNLPYDSTPSLARDLWEPGKPTELNQFAGELVRLADKHGIPAPLNKKIMERFIDRL